MRGSLPIENFKTIIRLKVVLLLLPHVLAILNSVIDKILLLLQLLLLNAPRKF